MTQTADNPFLQQTDEQRTLSHKAVRHRHEKLPKDSAPQEQMKYVVVQGETPLYTAEILKYGGGCWATVKVCEAMEGYEQLFRPNDVFDLRVAMYAWHRLP